MAMERNGKYRSWVEVDLDNFSHNWREIKRLIGKGVKVLQVVKADAYGHGAIEISNVALKNGAFCLGVANADEGVQLRVGGITAPIIILSPSTNSEINEILKYNLNPSVSNLPFARELQKLFAKAGSVANVHVEVDTGMGRGGTIYYEAFSLVEQILKMPNLNLEGVFSHLSCSEIEDEEYNRKQWENLSGLLSELEKHGINIPIRHMSNSGGVLNFREFDLDMIRPGIMTYGIYPGPATVSKANLLPVMSFKTSIVLLKEFPRGYSIGYNRTFHTLETTRIATIPVGYGDGYGVILSNKGEALINGKRAPIVGRVSMDMCTVDVTHIPECGLGDEVVLMGRQGREYISANEVAAKANTISYEVLCALGKRAPRIFVNKGKKDAIEPRLRRIFIPDEEKSIKRIDNMIRRCLQTRARDAEMGDAIYYEMFETLFGKEDRPLELRTNFKYDICINDFSKKDKDENGSAASFYKVTARVSYTKMLRDKVFLIGCAMNNRQLAALFEEERCEYRWLLTGRDESFRGTDFKVGSVKIDGVDVPVIRTDCTDRGYEIWCGGEALAKKVKQPVNMELEIETRKVKSNNLFSAYLVYPTRGMEICFNYEGSSLKNVRQIGFFAGRHSSPEVTEKKGKWIKLRISDDEWIFPTSGVTFIWDR